MMEAYQRAVIEAALQGNRKPMDDLELHYLSFLVRPHTADGEFWLPEPSEFAGLVLWPVTILRAPGPDGQTLVEWGGVEPCGKCLRRVRKRDCRKCGGRGHLSDVWEIECVTDIDGLIVFDAYGRRVE